MGGAFAFANCIIDDKEMHSEEIAESVIRAGAKSGATCAVAGALKVYLQCYSNHAIAFTSYTFPTYHT